MIVRLKAIKSKEDTFCYLSSYLHCSFLWHLVIVTFIYCIIRPLMSKLLYCIKNICSYRRAIGSSASHWLIEALSCCGEALGGIEVLSWSSPSHWVIESLSKCIVSVPNLISSEYLIDDGCVYPSSVNFFYRQACQSTSLMTDAYTYIRHWPTSPIDELITCQDAGEERSPYII